MTKLRWGPASFAVSLLALFMSLGGTGYALTQAGGVSSAAAQRSAHLVQASVPTAKPAWHNLTLKNGWVNGGFNSYRAGYYKDSQGIVHLRGSAANGSVNAPAFRLPRGARPARTLWLQTYALDGSAGGMSIQPNGNVFLFDSGSGSNAQAYTSFDGISFPVP